MSGFLCILYLEIIKKQNNKEKSVCVEVLEYVSLTVSFTAPKSDSTNVHEKVCCGEAESWGRYVEAL